MEENLRNTLLPYLVKGDKYQIPGRVVTGLPVNQAVIALPKPTMTTGSNWTASCVITGHLIAALRGTAEFWSGDHALLMVEGRDEIRRRHAEAAEMALGEDQSTTSMEDALRMVQITRTREWLSVITYTANGE